MLWEDEARDTKKIEYETELALMGFCENCAAAQLRLRSMWVVSQLVKMPTLAGTVQHSRGKLQKLISPYLRNSNRTHLRYGIQSRVCRKL